MSCTKQEKLGNEARAGICLEMMSQPSKDRRARRVDTAPPRNLVTKVFITVLQSLVARNSSDFCTEVMARP